MKLSPDLGTPLDPQALKAVQAGSWTDMIAKPNPPQPMIILALGSLTLPASFGFTGSVIGR